MDFAQLQSLFEPAGTGQQYTDNLALRAMFKNARPLSEAPLEIQYNNQKILRNNQSMGDITAPVITDYRKYNMTMGPTTYSQENRIGGEREYRESQYADRASTAAALADMRAQASSASSAPRLVNTKQVEQDPIYSPEEKLQMERTRLVMSKLPPEQQLMLNRAMRQHPATTTPSALAVASQDYKYSSDAADFFNKALLDGTMRKGDNGLEMLQQVAGEDAAGQPIMTRKYASLAPDQQRNFEAALRRGLINTNGLKVPNFSAAPNPSPSSSPPVVPEKLQNIGTTYESDLGLIGNIPNYLPSYKVADDAANFFFDNMSYQAGRSVEDMQEYGTQAKNAIMKFLWGKKANITPIPARPFDGYERSF